MRKKTKQEKIISGTFRPDRDDNKVKLNTKLESDLPPAPLWLSKTGKEYYHRLTEILLYAGVLQSADLDMLAQLAGELARYRLAITTMEKEGYVLKLPNGYHKCSEWNIIAKEAFKNCESLAQGWGFTFQSREKIGVSIAPKFNYNSLMSINGDGEAIIDSWFGEMTDSNIKALIKDLGKFIEDRKSGKG
jgi:P27 family predicted phage terminase small subunit